MQRSLARRRIAWCAAMALAAQSWLAPMAAAMAADQLQAVVICTGTGLRLMAVADSGRFLAAEPDQGRKSDGGAPGFDCPACVDHAPGNAGPAAPQVVGLPFEHGRVRLAPLDQRSPLRSFIGAPRSRAPPLA